MRLSSALIGLLIAIAPTVATAQSAPWYKWRNSQGREFCLQNDPGSGWTRVAGPFKDARCEKPGRPGQ
jgi:hypothetical protein